VQPAPQGLLIELPTPLLDGGGLDASGLAKLVKKAASQAHALVTAGPNAGQGQRLGEDLWQEAMQVVLEAAPKSLPVMAGLTAATTAATLERAHWLAGFSVGRELWGLDLALFHHSNRGLPSWLDKLADALGRPVVLVNQPDQVRGHRGATHHLNLMPKVLAKCGQSLAGVVISGSLKLAQGMSRALSDRPAIRLYEGDELSFLIRPASAGVMSAGASLLPKPWRMVIDSALGLAEEGTAGPKERRVLISAAGKVRELAELMASRPAAVAAILANASGLIQNPLAAGPRAEAKVAGAALAWFERGGLSDGIS
jgi:dihydrodipicolinate synthase/N-acetylneuraminate lyase